MPNPIANAFDREGIKLSIRCAVVGYGSQFSMGRHHATEIGKTPGLELAAAFDADPERRQAAREDHPEVFVPETYEDLLANAAIDLCILVTPHDTHAPLSIAANKAGKHVLTEKVMCLNVAECDAMIAAARDAGKMLTVYQNRRWDRDYLTVRKVLKSGILGNLFHIDSSVNGWWYPAGWRGVKKAGGGMLYDWGAHLFDQLIQIMLPAKPKTVFCTRNKGVWTDVDIDTQNNATIVFDNGVVGQIDVGCMSRTPRSRWLIRGEKSCLHMPDWDHAAAKMEIDGVVGTMDVEMEKDDWNGVYRNISEHLNEGKELIVKPEEVRIGIAAIEAALKSAESGRSADVVS